METLVQLGQQYKSEFEDKYEGIRQRGSEQLQQVQDKIQQIQPELQSKQDEFFALLHDMSPVAVGYSKPILETFAWIAVLLLASHVTSLVSGLILAPIIGLFVGSATAFLIAYVALPVAAVLHMDLDFYDNHTDTDIRFELLAFAMIEGILSGFLISERYLATIQPLSFVTPLLIAVIGSLAEGKIGYDRGPLLGLTIGVSAAVHLLVGLVIGQLSASYVLLVLLYSFIGLASVQYLFKDSVKSKSYLAMIGYYMAVLYAQLVVFAVLGGPKESMQSTE